MRPYQYLVFVEHFDGEGARVNSNHPLRSFEGMQLVFTDGSSYNLDNGMLTGPITSESWTETENIEASVLAEDLSTSHHSVIVISELDPGWYVITAVFSPELTFVSNPRPTGW